MVCLHVQDNMHVIRTEDLSHTVTSLQALHWQVVRRFQSGDCGDRLQLLGSFQRTWTKRPASSAREVFGAQLRQIRGCSVAASLAIMNRFGTTAGFVAALRGMERLAAEKLLAELQKEGKSSRKIGKAVAQRIWMTYMTNY
mmetsp:Transcript_11818/g.17742  ORF Transcript_11818/g.17742 Transcript_11818/m.17742 type:complete len:141 (-) Transcript_11818:196-618(-)